MTYQEALAYADSIKDIVIGSPYKGYIIESLFIAPTDWDDMTAFMNARTQKGDEIASIEYATQGKSLSVYGCATSPKTQGSIPTWNITNLDSWKLIVSN